MLGDKDYYREIILSKHKTYPPGVEIIRRIYLILNYLVGIIAIFGFLHTKNYSILGNYLLKFSFCFIVFYGIDKRKKWTTPVVLILSVLGLYNFILYLFAPVIAGHSLAFHNIFRAIGVMFIVFYCYSIIVFSKKQTRLFFNEQINHIRIFT